MALASLPSRRGRRDPFVAGARAVAVAAAIAAGAACGGDDGGAGGGGAGATVVHYDLAAGRAAATFFDRPWPADDRLRADGKLDLAGFPLPDASPSLADFVRGYVTRLGDATAGFGTNAAVFFRTSAPLDVASLPADASASLAAEATVFLLDVDPASPARGERVPVRVAARQEGTIYQPPYLLAVAPAPGFPLRSANRYAAVVTRGVRDAGGTPLATSPAFARARSGRTGDDETLARHAATLAPLWETLADTTGLDRSDVVAATVFTTRDVVGPTFRLRDWIVANVPVAPPTGFALVGTGEDEGVPYVELRGRFDTPNFQTGTPPYLARGGEIVFDAAGDPQLVRSENVRFALLLPPGPPPPRGWPVVVYAHGTGGDYLDVGDRGRAAGFARAGVAALGLDQPLHGDRVEGDWSFFFFNYLNPVAARDNARQAVADLVHATRLVASLVVPAALHPDGLETRFDPTRVLFMGHSQGGTNGPLFFAAEPDVPCAVMSGSGGGLVETILGKTDPLPILAVVSLIAGTLETGERDAFHPVLHLLQTFIEEADPASYAPYYARTPRGPAKSVLISEGLDDAYVTPDTVEAHAIAAGAAPLEPVRRLRDEFAAAGIARARTPLAGNVRGPDGRAVTLGLTQFPGYGHWALFEDPRGRVQWEEFVRSCAYGGVPVIPAGGG